MKIVYKNKKRNFRECPCCKDIQLTIKYRDEDKFFDGMWCQNCDIKFNHGYWSENFTEYGKITKIE